MGNVQPHLVIPPRRQNETHQPSLLESWDVSSRSATVLTVCYLTVIFKSTECLSHIK